MNIVRLLWFTFLGSLSAYLVCMVIAIAGLFIWPAPQYGTWGDGGELVQHLLPLVFYPAGLTVVCWVVIQIPMAAALCIPAWSPLIRTAFAGTFVTAVELFLAWRVLIAIDERPGLLIPITAHVLLAGYWTAYFTSARFQRASNQAPPQETSASGGSFSPR